MAADRTERLGTHKLEEDRASLKVRAFFGLPVPDAQRTQLEPYLAACAAIASEFRWTPAANLHLTIRFIGTIERSLVEGIADGLSTARLEGFELGLGELGTFKRGRLVRVAWLHASPGADQARELAAQVDADCVRAGLAQEARPFQPHLTLARARARDGSVLPALPGAPALPAWRADELILYSSHLGRAGSVYEPLRRLRLS